MVRAGVSRKWAWRRKHVKSADYQRYQQCWRGWHLRQCWHVGKKNKEEQGLVMVGVDGDQYLGFGS